MGPGHPVDCYLVILPAPLNTTRPYQVKKWIVTAATIEGFTVYLSNFYTVLHYAFIAAFWKVFAMFGVLYINLP